MRLIILGPPGAGKGTQAERICATHNIPHISTGEIFRDNIKRETPLGKQVKKILDEGGYVTDEITNDIVRDRLAQDDARNGFLLDGYPRTAAQVDALDRMLAEDGKKLDAAIQLTVDDEEVVQRLLKRAQESGRSDDTEEVIRQRQEIYGRETAPLTQAYLRSGNLYAIDGLGSPDEVTERIEQALATATDAKN